MTTSEMHDVVVGVLTRIAPELNPASVRPGVNLREELDLDSMDFLKFMLGLHERLGVEIPESDYPRLYTIDGAVAYLTSKTTSAPTR
ncbi:MAG: acyl carrier protein [Vicinamibacterales bacterium]